MQCKNLKVKCVITQNIISCNSCKISKDWCLLKHNYSKEIMENKYPFFLFDYWKMSKIFTIYV